MRRKELAIIVSLSVLFLDCFIISIYCTNDKHRVDDEISQLKRHWGDENKIKLLKIYYKTDTGRRGHQKRIKDKWDRLYGMQNDLSAQNLYMRAIRWIKKGEAERLLSEQERQSTSSNPTQKQIKWTPAMKEKLFKVYHETDPKKWKHSQRMKEHWDREYPNYRNITADNLITRSREVLKERGVLNNKTINFTEHEKTDLLRCYQMVPKEQREKMRMTRDLFIKRHPQYANVSCYALSHRVYYLRKQHPKLYEKFTKEASASNTVHQLWSSRESLGLEHAESISTPAFQIDDSLEELERYFDTNCDNALIDDIFGGASSSGHQTFVDVGTSHQINQPDSLANHHVPSDADPSHQNIIGHPGDFHAFSNVETRQQNIPGHPGDHYHFPDVGTSQQTIHPGSTWEQDAFTDAGIDDHTLHPGLYYSNERRGRSSKGKQPLLYTKI